MLKTSKTNYITGLTKKSKHPNYKPHRWIKDCGGCKAYKDDKCALKISIELVGEDIIHTPKNHNCPKPRTWAELEKIK